MPTVYLPTEHSDTELALAGRVAEALECSALYVTWSPRGYEGPDCEAVTVAPAAPPASTPTAAPADENWLSRAFSRLAALIVAAFTAPEDVERERRADLR